MKTEQIKQYYENYDEEGRMFRDKAHLVEWLTTIRYFDRLFTPGSRILDCCAGTGRYSFYLAEKGHHVTAGDLVPHNVELIKANSKADTLDDIIICDVMDMPQIEDNSFDIVLCMGALYHLATDAEKLKAIQNCVAVCNPGGLVVLSYITKIGAIVNSYKDDMSNIAGLMGILNDTDEGIFRCSYPATIAELAVQCRLAKLHHIGVDGMSQAFSSKINASSDDDFNKYLEFHYRVCEDENIIGTSVHGLFIGHKL
jgi:2-polyprenyl-3-methyl-5-hydroxy-6-metoxy-1,4-benzoquinol methylase